MDIKNKKRITLSDIAKLTGVSKTTVSIVLNGREKNFRIKSETCQKVRKVAKQQGYRANVYAKSLQAQQTNVIGLVIPDLTNYGFALTAKTLEKLCREKGLVLVIACSDDNPIQEKQAIERLLDRQVDLLITAPTHQETSYYHEITRHTPLLQLDRYIKNLDLAYVVSKETPAISELVARTIGAYQLKEYFYLGGQLSLSPSENRLKGFRLGLEKAGLIEQQGWIWHKNYQPESGYEMLESIVNTFGRLPQAIFTASYTLLEGVLRYLTVNNHMDKLFKGELHLTTFDDHDILNSLPFRIHSIEQNHTQIAQNIFKLIQKRLAQQKIQGSEIDCMIHWRDSD